MNEVHYKICPICGMSMDIEKTKCPACGYDGLQTTGGFGATITNEPVNDIPRPSINLQEIERKIQEAEEEHAYWQHFRREAAKDFMAAIIAREAPQYDFACRNVSIRVSEAIMWADELIKQLKEAKK